MCLLHTAWEGESCKKSRADSFSLCKLLGSENLHSKLCVMSNYVSIFHILSILTVCGVS